MYLEHLTVFSVVVNYFLKPMVKDIDLVLQIKMSLRKEGTAVLFYLPSLWATLMHQNPWSSKDYSFKNTNSPNILYRLKNKGLKR